MNKSDRSISRVLPIDKPTPVISRMLELLSDVNLTMSDVDVKLMQEFPELSTEGWHVGSTRKKLKLYPLLARTAAESRILLWRQLGRSKIDGYRVLSDALDATAVAADGSERPNHEVRLKAAEKMLMAMGENITPSAAKVNVSVGENSKIMIVTSDGWPVTDMV